MNIRAVLLLFFMASGVGPASAALDASFLRHSQTSAIYFHLGAADDVQGHLYFRRSEENSSDTVTLPFLTASPRLMADGLILTGAFRGHTMVNYVFGPTSAGFAEAMAFIPEIQAVNPDQRMEIPDRPGIYLHESGLLRQFAVIFDSEESVKALFPADSLVKFPDIIAVGIARGLRGRAFSDTGSMYRVRSLKQQRVRDGIAAFELPPEGGRLDVLYDVPPPSWAEGLPARVLKGLSAFAPLLVLIFTATGDVNKSRYKIFLWTMGAVYIIIYGGLFYVSAQRGDGLAEVIENVAFLALTVVIAFIGFWLKGGNLLRLKEEPAQAAV